MIFGVGFVGRLNRPLEILSSTDLGMKKPYSFVRIVPSAGLTSDALQRLEFS